MKNGDRKGRGRFIAFALGDYRRSISVVVLLLASLCVGAAVSDEWQKIGSSCSGSGGWVATGNAAQSACGGTDYKSCSGGSLTNGTKTLYDNTASSCGFGAARRYMLWECNPGYEFDNSSASCVEVCGAGGVWNGSTGECDFYACAEGELWNFVDGECQSLTTGDVDVEPVVLELQNLGVTLSDVNGTVIALGVAVVFFLGWVAGRR